MKKQFSRILCMFFTVLFLTGCGAVQPGATTTVPSTTQVPATTQVPTTTQVPPATEAPINIYWADPDAWNPADAYRKKDMVTGTILILETLKKAMAVSTNENDLFAVRVGTDFSRDHVYETFVCHLNIDDSYKEHYRENGILFLTEGQIKALECPTGYWLALNLAREIDSGARRLFKVQIVNKSGTEEEKRQLIDGLCADYGIYEDMISSLGNTNYYFTIRASVAFIEKLNKDDRVIKIEAGLGSDF